MLHAEDVHAESNGYHERIIVRQGVQSRFMNEVHFGKSVLPIRGSLGILAITVVKDKNV